MAWRKDHNTRTWTWEEPYHGPPTPQEAAEARARLEDPEHMCREITRAARHLPAGMYDEARSLGLRLETAFERGRHREALEVARALAEHAPHLPRNARIGNGMAWYLGHAWDSVPKFIGKLEERAGVTP